MSHLDLQGGSLFQYIRRHTLNKEEIKKIVQGIAAGKLAELNDILFQGMMHLHEQSIM